MSPIFYLLTRGSHVESSPHPFLSVQTSVITCLWIAIGVCCIVLSWWQKSSTLRIELRIYGVTVLAWSLALMLMMLLWK